jgi:hypothetical protein
MELMLPLEQAQRACYDQKKMTTTQKAFRLLVSIFLWKLTRGSAN